MGELLSAHEAAEQPFPGSAELVDSLVHRHQMHAITAEELLASRILVVDDEPANVRLLTRLLGMHGFTHVQGSTDPVAAVNIYRNTPQDLVLLDLHMPVLNGLGVLARLREIECDGYAPVLVMTTEDDPAIKLQVLQAGAKDIVTKPFDPQEVLSRICNQLEVRLLYNRLALQKAALEDAVHKQTRELEGMQLEVVRRSGCAA